MQLILDAMPAPAPALRLGVCMGEPLSWVVAESLYARQGRGFSLANFYGSTETENCTFRVPAPGTQEWLTQAHVRCLVPAGRPQPCVSIHILDPETLLPVLRGARGEICFGGVGSSGYWLQPKLTVERFVKPPGSEHASVYRTGDLGHWNTRGELEVLGRGDRQVKIRGIRIELDEVEATLKEAVTAAGGTESAAVIASAPMSDQSQIVGFVAPSSVNVDAIRKQSETQLPDYMVPSIFQAVAELPRLANGKVDLKSLSEQAAFAQESTPTLDSLGTLRMLSRAQVAEDRWLQNQQAFWVIVVMLGHLRIRSRADWPFVPKHICHLLGHGADMVAFMYILAVLDRRAPVQLGRREAIIALCFVLMHVVRCILNVFTHAVWIQGHEWFLLAYLWTRLLLCAAHAFKMPPRLQVACMFLASCFIPDDAWTVVPSLSSYLWGHDLVFYFYGYRRQFMFFPAAYFLSFHFATDVLQWAQRLSSRFSEWQMAVVAGAAWGAYFGLTFTHGILEIGYQHDHAVTPQGNHWVTFHFMRSSPAAYVTIWAWEAALMLCIPLTVAVGMTRCPWHFKRIGSATIGTYMSHPFFFKLVHPCLQAFVSWVTSFSSPAWLRLIFCFTLFIGICTTYAAFVGPAVKVAVVALVQRAHVALAQLEREHPEREALVVTKACK